jgi:hypothetical protein
VSSFAGQNHASRDVASSRIPVRRGLRTLGRHVLFDFWIFLAVAFLVVLSLSLLSPFRITFLRWPGTTEGLSLAARRGVLEATYLNEWWSGRPHDGVERPWRYRNFEWTDSNFHSIATMWQDPMALRLTNAFGFAWRPIDRIYYYIAVPMWFLGLLLLMPMIPVSKQWARKRRMAAGRCPACGYDLRATPDRCPECGHQPDGDG